MKRFLSKRVPPFHRVLLVESGSRYLIENLLPGVYSHHPELLQADVFTCFPGTPANFDPARGRILRTTDVQGRTARKAFYNQLRATRYDILGIVCSGEAIMPRWKWALVLQIPAKVFILNENGDYFWLDRGQWKTIRHFMLFRAGLSGAEGIATLARLALFPFTFSYLLLFAIFIHTRRALRS